ncbi:MAG: oxidoreductase [Pseudomonadales bacterium]|jgi:NAD(P)-dependent dehydrogenase (short-subunit alcohol dehydrogenase family)|nr:oxidoreductase [Pseudomonadales bacterium]
MRSDGQTPIGSGFGAKSEPDEIMAGIDLSGRHAIVTGGYSGIGLETVRALTAAGATVTVPARSLDKAQAALADLEGVEIASMDLADLSTVRAFANAWADAHERLDLLVNNAGIMACPEARVGPGWESQFGTNHMGHFALTLALMPRLLAARAPRVIALSSIAHRMSGIRWDDIQYETTPYDKWQAYGQAKTANALFARALHPRLAEAGGHAFSVHPGGIFTPLQRHLPIEEMQALGWLGEDGKPSALASAHFKTPTQGCSTTLWTATSPQLVEHGGQYCEDCDIAQAVAEDSAGFGGVRAQATDPEQAERLWTLSEALLAEA